MRAAVEDYTEEALRLQTPRGRRAEKGSYGIEHKANKGRPRAPKAGQEREVLMGVMEWVLILAASLVFVAVAGVLLRSLGSKGERSESSND